MPVDEPDEPVPVDEPLPEDDPLVELPEPDDELPVFEPSLQTPQDASHLPANHACPQKPHETASLHDSEDLGVSVQAVWPEVELPVFELPEPEEPLLLVPVPELLVPEPVLLLPEFELVPLPELPLLALPFVLPFDPCSLADDLPPSDPPSSSQPRTNMPSNGKQNAETVLILNIV